ncbi:DUF6049 family protein [Nonomuraea antimicrobica]
MIRKATLIAALSAALLAPVMAVTPHQAAAKPTANAAQRQTASVSISSITPDVPKSLTDQITFTGTVRNDTGSTLYNVLIRLRYESQPFADRTTMSSYAADQSLTTLPGSVSSNSRAVIPSLAPGASQRWQFTATPVQLSLRSFGVYPIAVDVAPNGVPLVAQRTFLTYAPPTVPKLPSNKLSVALPVIDQPHRGTDVDPQSGKPLFVDDKLSQSIAGRGRLADLATIAQSAPDSVTWVIEPSLLDDLNAMAKGYDVKTKDGPQAKPPSAAATQWLTTMRTALAASPVVAVPYADPDVAALAHQGLDTQTDRAIKLGGQTVAATISPNTKTNINWPPAGLLDADALDLLSVSGVNTVLLNSTNLPPQAPSPPRPTRPRRSTRSTARSPRWSPTPS